MRIQNSTFHQAASVDGVYMNICGSIDRTAQTVVIFSKGSLNWKSVYGPTRIAVAFKSFAAFLPVFRRKGCSSRARADF